VIFTSVCFWFLLVCVDLHGCRFIQLCDCVLEDLAIEGRGFTDSFLQLMLALHQDRVPNVRISLARTLARHADRLGLLTSSL
jgi:hypothetical protein